MSRINFNHFTKEIEMKGSEFFIESNFDKIQDLLVESFGVKKKMVSKKTKATQEHKSVVKVKESQAGAEIKRDVLPKEPSVLPVSIALMPEISRETKAARPPLRKYIRKVGKPGHERTVVEIVEEKPKGITLASLKEKFGFSESKIGGIIRDSEKFGKARRVMNGSYAWLQD